MNYESLIFDVDGTLWDARALSAEGYNIQLRKENLHHLQTNQEVLLKLFGKTTDVIADHLFREIPPEQRYALMDRCIASEDAYLIANPCEAAAYPGVRETMEKLAKKHRLFLVSNGQKGYPQLAAKKLGIDHLVSGCLSYGDTGTSKGQTIRTLMGQHGIESAVYIGDTQGDMEASYQAGLPFVFCRYGFGTPKKWDEEVDSFEQLLKLFE